jgi:outer membrane protein assembly factor BamB
MWLLAGVLVLVAIVAVVYAIHESSKPGNSVNLNVPFNTGTATTPTKTSAAANNFAWSLYGYDRARTKAFNGESGLVPPFRTAWQLGGNALLEFPASIYGNNLYYLDGGATVKRINVRNGHQYWETHIGLRSASTPALDPKDKLLFVSVLSTIGTSTSDFNGVFAAVSMITGKIAWKVSVPSGTESSPIVIGHSVYFGDQGGTLYSLNVLTGKENWSLQTSGPVKAGPAYADGNLYFGNYGGSFYAVNAKSGKVVWSDSVGGEFYSTPAIAFGRVYVGNNSGAAYSFALSNGAEAWSRALSGYAYSGPAVADTPGLGPTVYIGSYGGYLYALNAKTGATEWAFADGHRSISGSVTDINNVVYFSAVYDHTSYGVNATTGKQLFSFPDGSYTTVVANPTAVFLMGRYVLYKLVPKG